MSDRFVNSKYLVDSPIGDCTILVDDEEEVTRVGTGFTFLPITLENPAVVTYFKGDELYCEMRASLIGHLRRLPSHREIVWWLEECFRARAHGFPYLFRKGDHLPMNDHGRRLGSDPDYSWVDGAVMEVVSYYHSVDQLNENLLSLPGSWALEGPKGAENGVQPLSRLWFCHLQHSEWGTGCFCPLQQFQVEEASSFKGGAFPTPPSFLGFRESITILA